MPLLHLHVLLVALFSGRPALLQLAALVSLMAAVLWAALLAVLLSCAHLHGPGLDNVPSAVL